MRTIYLDYNSTTPLDAGVREKMAPFLEGEFGNPSSLHAIGRRARAALDDARDRVSRVLKCSPGELVFSSGGTESNNLAILGAARSLREKGRHIIVSSVEHPSVLGPCEYLLDKEGFSVSKIPVDRFGVVSPADVSALIRNDTVLVSVMAANNVVGSIQPVQEIGALCRDKGVLFHTDASQWFGKLPLLSVHSFNADLVSFCAHKFHGPKGAGALFVRSQSPFSPCLAGGPQENERRPGTENVSACVGMAEAVERFVATPVFSTPFIRSLTNLPSLLAPFFPALLGHPASRLPNTFSFSIPGSDGSSFLAALDIEGVCASSGSACSSGSSSPSHVVAAMGMPASASSIVRFSFGRENTHDDLASLLHIIPSLVRPHLACL